MILAAREYVENIEQIKSLGSFCSIKINIGKKSMIFSSTYRHQDGSGLYLKGYSGTTPQDQKTDFLAWLDQNINSSKNIPHVLGGDFNLDLNKPRAGENLFSNEGRRL